MNEICVENSLLTTHYSHYAQCKQVVHVRYATHNIFRCCPESTDCRCLSRSRLVVVFFFFCVLHFIVVCKPNDFDSSMEMVRACGQWHLPEFGCTAKRRFLFSFFSSYLL